MARVLPLLLALGAGSLACTAHVTGALEVDGAPFQPTTCRSGPSLGFSGIELADEQGHRLRLAQTLDGTPAMIYFSPGQPIGENLGACAAVRAVFGVAVVNGVRNLEGYATLACETPRRRVTGTVQFENCH
jgi:hypothetical protein